MTCACCLGRVGCKVLECRGGRLGIYDVMATESSGPGPMLINNSLLHGLCDFLLERNRRNQPDI